jgi:hypothetical protein
MYKVRSCTMLGTSHSWAVTMRSLLKELKYSGHSLSISSINGLDLLDKDHERRCVLYV